MARRPSLVDRALSGLLVFLAEAGVAVAVIVLSLVVAVIATVLV